MLPFKNRIKKKNDFKKILERGEVVYSEMMVVKILKNGPSDETRFGFIVSKKVSKKANERNKIKRILREQIRQILPATEKGYDIVVVAKKEILKRGSEEIGFEIKNLFNKKGILN